MVAPWLHRLSQKCPCVRNEFLYPSLAQCKDSMEAMAWPVCIANPRLAGNFVSLCVRYTYPPWSLTLGNFRSANAADLVLNVHSVTIQSFSGLKSFQMLRVSLHCDFPRTGRLRGSTVVCLCGSAMPQHTEAEVTMGSVCDFAVGTVPGLDFVLPPLWPWKNMDWPSVWSLWCLPLAPLHISLQKMATVPGACVSQSPPHMLTSAGAGAA